MIFFVSPASSSSWCADKRGLGVRLGGAAKGAQVAMGRPCLETKRWQVGKADALLGPTRRRTQAGKTGNKMGRRCRGICQRARTKVGDLGGRQQRLADGRSWTCEESEGARRRRSQISIFQVTAAFSPRSYGVRIFRRGSLSLSFACGFLVLYALALVSSP